MSWLEKFLGVFQGDGECQGDDNIISKLSQKAEP